MIIIQNGIIPFKGFKAINICGIVFVRKNSKMTAVDYNHENIHTRQMLEMAIIPFYLLYLIEWMIRCLVCWDSREAYRNVSFEKEAYKHQSDLTYLKSRTHFSQFRK